MSLKKLSTKTISSVKRDIGDLHLLAYKSPVVSGSYANPLHHAVLGSFTPESFKQNLLDTLGPTPELDRYLDERLGVFPSAACHPYIRGSFSEIDIAILEGLSLGRTPPEILTAIRRYTGKARYIAADYFLGVDLSMSPNLVKFLS